VVCDIICSNYVAKPVPWLNSTSEEGIPAIFDFSLTLFPWEVHVHAYTRKQMEVWQNECSLAFWSEGNPYVNLTVCNLMQKFNCNLHAHTEVWHTDPWKWHSSDVSSCTVGSCLLCVLRGSEVCSVEGQDISSVLGASINRSLL